MTASRVNSSGKDIIYEKGVEKMSCTVSYSMRLKNIDDIEVVLGILREKVIQLDWEFEEFGRNGQKGIVIDTNNIECETIVIVFDGAVCDGFVKYLGIDKSFLWKIFDIFWLIKPRLNRLRINDELEQWDEYMSEHKKIQLPLFRTLTDAEKDEIHREFDIEKSNQRFFSPKISVEDKFGKQREAFYQMIRKDLSDDLDSPVNYDDIKRILADCPNIHNSAGFNGHLDENKTDSYRVVIKLWIYKKLVDKSGVAASKPIDMNKTEGQTRTYTNMVSYGCSMLSLLRGYYGGIIDAKHSRMNRLIRKLENEDYDFRENETFFRLAYSLLEYAGFYRPKELILRRKTEEL